MSVTSIVADTKACEQSPLDTAYAYAELGMAIIPLCGPRHRCNSPGKVPVDLQTGRHQDGWQARGVPTTEEIDTWLSLPLARRANLGCIMGTASGLIGVDVDGPEGEEALRRLSSGDLPPTWEYRTSPGRRRLVYALPKGVAIPSSKPGPQLEVLSDGRQMVLPPSVHPAGHRYTWVPGRDPWTFGPAAPAPEWLLTMSKTAAPKRTPQEWAAIIRDGATPGDRHPTLTQLAGHLLGKRVDPRVALELLLAWNQARCRPPKPTEEIVDIVRYLWRRDMERGRSA